MKIFFTGSPRALKTLDKEYKLIYDSIKSLGHTHLSDLVIQADPERFYKTTRDQINENYKETLKNLAECDVLVVELSIHSMSMGYLVSRALEMSKPVIGLYIKGNSPFFFSGIENDRFQLFEYDLDNLKNILKEAFDYAQDISDTRFNFLISPSLLEYLDWIAKNRRIPRSVYLRKLIEADRDKNKDYNK